jgi:hypothetical protein
MCRLGDLRPILGRCHGKRDFLGAQALEQGDWDGFVTRQLSGQVITTWSKIAIWRVGVLSKLEKDLNRIDR